MEICIFASGSKGNCLYISDGKTFILVDAGYSYRTIAARAAAAGIDISGVGAIISTHCHYDHSRGISSVIDSLGIPVYAHADGIEALSLLYGIGKKHIVPFKGDFFIGGLRFSPYLLSHDAPACCGISIESGGRRVSIATDLGKVDEEALAHMRGADLVVIESNHDVEMLKKGRYSAALKRRILSPVGHLSNEQCAEAMEKLLEWGTKAFVLAHLSEENNLPELAFSCATQRLLSLCAREGRDYSLYLAGQRWPTGVFAL
ncbi:MAG: MBL fold metallo-hydrolase [Clostridiales bacterium]|nr:MBL fold metallo-hydrolase [Clostridiales bacterium]